MLRASLATEPLAKGPPPVGHNPHPPGKAQESCVLAQAGIQKSLPPESTESIGPFWKVLMRDFGEKIPHGPQL